MKNLKKIRKCLGISQSMLAKISGLTASAISQFESGKREPNLKSIRAILKVLPTTFEKLTK